MTLSFPLSFPFDISQQLAKGVVADFMQIARDAF